MSRPPKGLGPRGRRLWRDRAAELEDLDELTAPAREQLLEACRTLDLVERIDQELAGALTVTGSQGQLRPHPLLPVRSAYLADLAKLLGV